MCRFAVVALVFRSSNLPLTVTFEPSSMAVALPEPVSSARVRASAGTAERRAFQVCFVWAVREIASAAITAYRMNVMVVLDCPRTILHVPYAMCAPVVWT